MTNDVVAAWLTLPRRIYLDTSTLQTMYDYDGVLWENEPFEPLPRDAKVPGLADEIDALQKIFLIKSGPTSSSQSPRQACAR